jgi:flagellar assembly factor FliW
MCGGFGCLRANSLRQMDGLDGIVLDFPLGLPGFENATRFMLKAEPKLAPVSFLKGLDTAELCFLVVPVGAVLRDYELSVTGEDLRTIGLDEDRQPAAGGNVLCLAILTAPENGPLTANLLAPVVANLATGKAVQAVRADTLYSHQHVIAALETGVSC